MAQQCFTGPGIITLLNQTGSFSVVSATDPTQTIGSFTGTPYSGNAQPQGSQRGVLEIPAGDWCATYPDNWQADASCEDGCQLPPIPQLAFTATGSADPIDPATLPGASCDNPSSVSLCELQDILDGLTEIVTAIEEKQDIEYVNTGWICSPDTNTWTQTITPYIDGIAQEPQVVDSGVDCSQPAPLDRVDVEKIEVCDPDTQTLHVKVCQYTTSYDEGGVATTDELVLSDTDTGIACVQQTEHAFQVCSRTDSVWIDNQVSADRPHNGALYPQDNWSVELTLSDGSVVTVDHPATGGGTWGPNIAALAADIETATGIPYALSIGAGDDDSEETPYFGHLRAEICAGDLHVVQASATTIGGKRDGRIINLATGYDAGQKTYFTRCVVKGEPDAWLDADGNDVEKPLCLGNCDYEPVFPPSDCTSTTLGPLCHILSDDPSTATTDDIVRSGVFIERDCSGQVISFFTLDAEDPEVYEFEEGYIGDCDSLEPVELEPIEEPICLTPMGKEQCYGGANSDGDFQYVNPDNETDGVFSIGGTDNNTIKWEVVDAPPDDDGLAAFTLEIADCINGGGTASISVTDSSGNVFLYDADSIQASGNPDGSGGWAFGGSGPASGSGKIGSGATLICTNANSSGQGKACSFYDCVNDVIVWKDSITGVELTATQIESLADCPAPEVCEESRSEVIRCAIEEGATDDGTAIAVGDQLLTLLTVDCNNVVLESAVYHLASGELVSSALLADQCDPEPDIETVRECILDTAGVQWTQINIFDPSDPSAVVSLYYDANFQIGTPSGEPSEWTSCSTEPCKKTCELAEGQCREVGSISGTNLGLGISGSGTTGHTVKHDTGSQSVTDQVNAWVNAGYIVVITFDTGEVGVVDAMSFYSPTNQTFVATADHTIADPCGLYSMAVDGSSSNGAAVTYVAYEVGEEGADGCEVEIVSICPSDVVKVEVQEPEPVEECTIDYFLGCDDVNGDGSSIVTFLKPIQTCFLGGVQTSQAALPFLDENLDPYTPTNEVACDPSTLDFDEEFYCDAGTTPSSSFIRRTVVVAGVGAIIEEVELDGTTAYTPIGPITQGVCPAFQQEPTVVPCGTICRGIYNSGRGGVNVPGTTDFELLDSDGNVIVGPSVDFDTFLSDITAAGISVQAPVAILNDDGLPTADADYFVVTDDNVSGFQYNSPNFGDVSVFLTCETIYAQAVKQTCTIEMPEPEPQQLRGKVSLPQVCALINGENVYVTPVEVYDGSTGDTVSIEYKDETGATITDTVEIVEDCDCQNCDACGCPELMVGEPTQLDASGDPLPYPISFPFTTQPSQVQDFIVPFAITASSCLTELDPATMIRTRIYARDHDLITGANGSTGFLAVIGDATSGAQLVAESPSNTFDNVAPGYIGTLQGGIGTVIGSEDFADRWIEFDIPLQELLDGTTVTTSAFGASTTGTTETLGDLLILITEDLSALGCDDC